MGWWDYKNIGASASRQNLKYVEKLFDYMGYCPDPDCGLLSAEYTDGAILWYL